MMQWTDRCAGVLLVPGLTMDAALQGAVELSHLLGFDYCGYTLETMLPLNAPRALFLNNLDGELLTCVEDWRQRSVLPPAVHARHSSELMLWPVDKDSTDLYWMDMRRLGVRGGWSLAASDRRHAIGRFTALRTSGPLAPDEHITELYRWTVLTETMDSVVRKLVYPTMLVNDTISLTRAELDVLVWAADGKTSWETSQILGVTERHVAYLRGQAIMKLGGNNIIDSVVKAMTLGLLNRPVEPL